MPLRGEPLEKKEVPRNGICWWNSRLEIAFPQNVLPLYLVCPFGIKKPFACYGRLCSDQSLQDSFSFQCRHNLLLQTDLSAYGNVSKKLKHCFIITGNWDIHWSVHLLSRAGRAEAHSSRYKPEISQHGKRMKYHMYYDVPSRGHFHSWVRKPYMWSDELP